MAHQVFDKDAICRAFVGPDGQTREMRARDVAVAIGRPRASVGSVLSFLVDQGRLCSRTERPRGCTGKYNVYWLAAAPAPKAPPRVVRHYWPAGVVGPCSSVEPLKCGPVSLPLEPWLAGGEA
jgi:hypothetical protein